MITKYFHIWKFNLIPSQGHNPRRMPRLEYAKYPFICNHHLFRFYNMYFTFQPTIDNWFMLYKLEHKIDSQSFVKMIILLSLCCVGTCGENFYILKFGFYKLCGIKLWNWNRWKCFFPSTQFDLPFWSSSLSIIYFCVWYLHNIGYLRYYP